MFSSIPISNFYNLSKIKIKKTTYKNELNVRYEYSVIWLFYSIF